MEYAPVAASAVAVPRDAVPTNASTFAPGSAVPVTAVDLSFTSLISADAGLTVSTIISFVAVFAAYAVSTYSALIVNVPSLKLVADIALGLITNVPAATSDSTLIPFTYTFMFLPASAVTSTSSLLLSFV